MSSLFPASIPCLHHGCLFTLSQLRRSFHLRVGLFNSLMQQMIDFFIIIIFFLD